MKKEIALKPPCKEYDVQGIESWLQYQSLTGNYLFDTAGRTFYFREGEPKKLVFRLEPHGKKRIDEKQKEEWRKAGLDLFGHLSASLRNFLFRDRRERGGGSSGCLPECGTPVSGSEVWKLENLGDCFDSGSGGIVLAELEEERYDPSVFLWKWIVCSPSACRVSDVLDFCIGDGNMAQTADERAEEQTVHARGGISAFHEKGREIFKGSGSALDCECPGCACNESFRFHWQSGETEKGRGFLSLSEMEGQYYTPVMGNVDPIRQYYREERNPLVKKNLYVSQSGYKFQTQKELEQYAEAGRSDEIRSCERESPG